MVQVERVTGVILPDLIAAVYYYFMRKVESMSNILPLMGGLKLVDDYLKARGLARDDFETINLVDPANHLLYKTYGFSLSKSHYRQALLLTYLRPDGKAYMESRTVDGKTVQVPYALLRYLGAPVGVPLDKIDDVPKVLAPWGRRSELHFEPLARGGSWLSLADGSTIVHVESLVKAKAVTKMTGLPAIGYNGVWGFVSSRQGVELIHKMVDFAFSRYTNVVLWDSNVDTNPDVAASRASLLHKMRHILGVSTLKVATLPKQADGSDWGPDDFLQVHGSEALARVVAEAEPYVDERYSDLVEAVNDKCWWVKDMTRCFLRDQAMAVGASDARNQLAPINRAVTSGKGGGERIVFGYDMWLKSPNRVEVDTIGYMYLMDETYQRGNKLVANMYRRAGAWPRPMADRGDAVGVGGGSEGFRLAMELMRVLLGDKLEYVRSYLRFLKFTPHKPTSYPILWSSARGVGKGWLTKMATRLLGEPNVGSTTADQLAGTSNAHVTGKRLVVLNEVSAKVENRKAIVGFLKSFIGDDVIARKQLYMDVVTVENHAGLLITANELGDMPSDGLSDRRSVYVACGGPAWPGEDPRWDQVWMALEGGEGGGVGEVMAEVAEWVEGGREVDYRSWRPEMTAQRATDLLAGRSPHEEVLWDIRHEFIEQGVRVCYMAHIYYRAEQLGWDLKKYLSGRAISLAMKATGWHTIDEWKRLGPSKVSAWAVVDPKQPAPAEVRRWDGVVSPFSGVLISPMPPVLVGENPRLMESLAATGKIIMAAEGKF